MATTIQEQKEPSIYEQARVWYNSRAKVDNPCLKIDNPAVYIGDFFKKHENKFVPHQIQLTEAEEKEFELSRAAATYGECDLQDMARVMRKYLTGKETTKKIVELGAGRGQLTALFFFSDLQTDVHACELSVQRFNSACTFVRLLADEFQFFHSFTQPHEFLVINPGGRALILQRINFFNLPPTVYEDADFVMMDVHLPEKVLDRDLVHAFRLLPAQTPLIAYNRNKRIWPSPPFTLSPLPEVIRTDWNPDGYGFQVYHYHHDHQ